MLTKETEYRIDCLVQDDLLGDEISARLINITPNKDQAASILSILDKSPETNLQIELRLKNSLGSFENNKYGAEIARKINGCVEVLSAFVAGDCTRQKLAMGEEKMSTEAFDALAIAMQSVESAKEFRNAYNRMVRCIQDIK